MPRVRVCVSIRPDLTDVYGTELFGRNPTQQTEKNKYKRQPKLPFAAGRLNMSGRNTPTPPIQYTPTRPACQDSQCVTDMPIVSSKAHPRKSAQKIRSHLSARLLQLQADEKRRECGCGREIL